jgi:cytochrome c-type biogenesis protein CcsB
MSSSYILSITTYAYGLAAFLYISALVFRKPAIAFPARLAVIAAVGLHLFGFIFRWVESYQMGVGHAPLSNQYESYIFFAMTIGMLYLYIELRYRNRMVGAFAMPLAFLFMAYASLSPNISDRIQPLIPALKSNWLIAHVITCFIGYAAFAVAFGVGIMYLCKSGREDRTDGMLALFPDLRVMDELTYQMVMFGFLFLTVGIITGSVWANSAWGTYWSWDPKETWSLITWFIYATMLHARTMRGWSGRRIAILAIIGFSAVLFTYIGVNRLLPGLHAYG